MFQEIENPCKKVSDLLLSFLLPWSAPHLYFRLLSPLSSRNFSGIILLNYPIYYNSGSPVQNGTATQDRHPAPAPHSWDVKSGRLEQLTFKKYVAGCTVVLARSQVYNLHQAVRKITTKIRNYVFVEEKENSYRRQIFQPSWSAYMGT